MNVASLNVGIGGDPAALINALNASTRAVTQFSSDVQQMNTRVNQSAFSIGRLLAAVTTGISVREVLNYADSWKLVEARLALVTQSTGELRRVQNELFQISQDTRSEFEANATLYQRLAQSQRSLGLTSRDVIRITRTVASALAIEGRSVAEVSSTIRQLGQAFASGRFQGDELRSVSENASLLFQKMAENLGLTIGQLRELASENKLAITDVARAILQAGDEIDKQAGKLPTTIGGAFVQLRNSVQRFVGETDRALGVTTRLVAAINALGRQFDNNRAAVEAFAFALGAAGLVRAAFAARAALLQLAAVQTAAAWLALLPAIRSVRDLLYLASIAARGFWAALTGPVGLAVVGITAITALFFQWRKRAQEAREQTEQLRTALEKLTPTELKQKVQDTIATLFVLEDKQRQLREQISGLAAQRLPPSQAQLDSLQTLKTQITQTTATLGVLRDVLTSTGANVPPPVPTGADDALKKFAESTQRVIETFKIMKASGEHVHNVVTRLRDLFDQTQRKLKGLKDPFSEDALRLRRILEDLAELPEIKLRLRIDTTTRELRQMTEAEVAKLTAELTRQDSSLIPKVSIRPLIDTSLATRSVSQFLRTVPPEMARAVERIRFDVLRDRLAEQLGSIPIKFEPVGLDRFQSAVDKAVQAQNRLNLARLGGDRAQIIDAERQYANAIETVRGALGQLARNLDSTTAKSDDQAKALEAINAAAAQLGTSLTGATSRLDRFLNFARAATGIGRAILGIAEAARRVSDEMRRTLTSAVNLFDALVDLAQAQKELRAGTGSPIAVATSGLGAAGAGIALVNSIVQTIQSDNEKLRQVIREQTEIMRENNRNLERLRLDVGGFTGSISDLQTAIDAIRLPAQVPGAPSMLELIRQIGEWERTGTGPSTRNALDAALEAAGTSLAALDQIAQDLGIQLFDQAGRIIPDAFALLDDAIELHIKSLTRWRQTLDDQRQRFELEADVFDFPTSAEASIDQGLTLLRNLAPSLFEKFFAGIDPKDAEAVETALRALTRTLLDNVDLIAQDLGDLLGKDELIQIIQLVEQGLDGLADAANDVTASLLNVPTGFRVERARFDATMTREMERFRDKVEQIFNTPFTPPVPVIPSDGESVTTGVVGGGFGGGTVIIVEGDVLVDARDKPAAELTEAIKRDLKDKARTLGLTAKPSDMLNL